MNVLIITDGDFNDRHAVDREIDRLPIGDFILFDPRYDLGRHLTTFIHDRGRRSLPIGPDWWSVARPDMIGAALIFSADPTWGATAVAAIQSLGIPASHFDR